MEKPCSESKRMRFSLGNRGLERFAVRFSFEKRVVEGV